MPLQHEHIAFYHGSQQAPWELEGGVLRAGPVYTKINDDGTVSQTKGVYVSKSKPYSSWFATEWSGAHREHTNPGKGYLYEMHNLETHVSELGGEQDGTYVKGNVTPEYYREVQRKRNRALSKSPWKAKTEDFQYGRRKQFKPYYYRTQNGKKVRVKNTRRK